MWDYVIERFCIASVLDLGSGIGNASYWFLLLEGRVAG
jgi:hypothetical protein